MANEITATIYGSFFSDEQTARNRAVQSIQGAKIYLLQSLDKQNETEMFEAIEIIGKLDKIEKKIQKL